MVSSPAPVDAKELLSDVQGDILAGGIPKKNEDFLFFHIEDPKDFCRRLHLDTTLSLFSSGEFVAQRRLAIKATKVASLDDPLGLLQDGVDIGIANLSFTRAGLAKIQEALPADSLGLELWEARDPAFFRGMEEDASKNLKDPMELWETEFKNRKIHGLVLVGGSADVFVQDTLKLILKAFGSSISVVKNESGVVRQGKMKDHEHFGFNDGVSQPTVEGFPQDNNKVFHGSVGARGTEWNTFPQSTFVVQDADGVSRPKWTRHGSFLVFRKLEQDVKKWNDDIVADAERRGMDPTLLASKIVGRWPSGCPVMHSTTHDDESKGFHNDFDFHSTPRDNKNDAICPGGAHIRKMNPNRGQTEDRNRTDGIMIRRGITYGTDFDDGRGVGDRGLLFVCYQSSIDKGFRFVQKFWANANEFPVSGSGIDTLTGNTTHNEVSEFFIADDDRKKKISKFEFRGINPFVKSRGGEYFFTPSLTALRDTLSIAALST